MGLLKKITVLFLFLGFFIFIQKPLFAQTSTNITDSIIDNISVPGWTCGVAEDLKKNKCCQMKAPYSISALDYLKVPVLSEAIKIVDKVKSFLFNQLVTPIAERMKKSPVGAPCASGIPSTVDFNDPDCRCIEPVRSNKDSLMSLQSLCQVQENVSERSKCVDCIVSGGVWSGIGCIKTNIKDFIEENVFNFGVGLAGLSSLLCLIYGAFMMQTSQGNAEKIKKAQQLITSCLIGLILIIFSVFILNLLGVSILGIPGFS